MSLNNFQILALVVSGTFLTIVVVGMARGRLGWRSGLAWSLLWVTTGLLVTFPQTTVVVAGWLGITRGADLVFYISILAMFVGFFLVFLRLRRIDRNLTEIVRTVALLDPKLPDETLEEGAEPASGDS